MTASGAVLAILRRLSLCEKRRARYRGRCWVDAFSEFRRKKIVAGLGSLYSRGREAIGHRFLFDTRRRRVQVFSEVREIFDQSFVEIIAVGLLSMSVTTLRM